jgi:protein SCO1/2
MLARDDGPPRRDDRDQVRKEFFKIFRSVVGLLVVVVGIGAVTPGALAQKTEHYQSPLYSPRKYDPAQGAGNGLPDALQEIGIEQKLGEQLPLDAEVTREDGQKVKLGSIFESGRPVVLAFVYYECPMLCNEVLNGLTGSLKGMSLDAGKDFDVIALSFDAKENDKPELARNKKAAYMERYGRPGSEKGWHFLTADQTSIDAIAKAAGFKYRWDEKTQQFAHAGGVMTVTPQGKMSRYFFGIDYSPRDLKLGLMESASSKVGSAADQLLLYCYHYDPSTGRYGLAVINMIRIGAVLTLLGMGAMGFVFWRRGKKVVNS